MSQVALQFQCTQCGACCSGKPRGRLVVTAEELARAEAITGQRLQTVVRRGQRVVVLTAEGDCPLLGALCNGKRLCPIHECQFQGCQPKWPFVAENLASPEVWARAAATCPGMNCGDSC